MHVESWLLRAALLGLAAYQLATHNPSGAAVAAQGFVVALIPLAVSRFSKTHVPRPLDAAFTGGMALQYISESTKLFEVFTYWDKIVHPTLVALTALLGVWLLLGYADAHRKRIPIQFGGAFGLMLGMSVGALWEFVELASDWFGGANLQKSNADTLTDIIANDIGAFVATLFGLWLFTHVLTNTQRRELGAIAAWLARGPGVLLDRHGRLGGALAAAAFVAIVVASQWVDRDQPALASGLPSGHSLDLNFVTDPNADALVLSGDWVPDPRGICRMNLEQPRPGSEKPGVLQLASGAVYGRAPFSVEATYFEERPPRSQGTEMDAGIAFGIRDAQDYYLLEQSALHDVLRLDHVIHNRRRDVREKLYRTHGNEWHTLRLDVSASSVTASVDGRSIFSVSRTPDAEGGVGLWARAAAATCFGEVHVSVAGGNS